MKEVLLSLALGSFAGVIDVIPMIMQRLNKYAIISAFIHWVLLGMVITFIKLPGLEGWLKGLVVAVLLSLPVLALVIEKEPKSLIPITIMSVLLGSLVGWLSTKIV